MDEKELLEVEARLAAALARLGAQHRKLVLANLGMPPRFENVPNDVWALIASENGMALERFLGDVFEQAALGVFASPGVPGIDPLVIVSEAARFLQAYNFNRLGIYSEADQAAISQLTATQRRALRDALTEFYQDADANMGLLRARIEPIFGASRAELIAATETTRANAMGRRAGADAIEREFGITPKKLEWQTNADDIVCEICAPLNGKLAERRGMGGEPVWVHPNTGKEYSEPPAHPRCRCGVGYLYA